MQYAFDADLGAVHVGPHLFALAGMLDDSWHNRTGWTVAGKLRWSASRSDSDGARLAHNLVVDDRVLYGLKAFASDHRTSRFQPADKGYTLFRIPLGNGQQAERRAKARTGRRRDSSGDFSWRRQVPVRGTALVKAADKIVFAGAPDVVDPSNPWASFEGRAGGRLCLAAAASGEQLAELAIPSPPVFNGMAATENRIWLTTMDGRLRAFAAE
jgi:hypothetical protein